MEKDTISDRTVTAFARFVLFLPSGKEIDLVILKAHLLIEEQIRQIIDEHLKNPSAIEKLDFTCHECICLAQALLPSEIEPWLWKSLIKLNKLRNDIAHKLEPKGLDDRIEDFIQSVPSSFVDVEDKGMRFELTLWSLFVAVADLVEKPSEQTLELVRPQN